MNEDPWLVAWEKLKVLIDSGASQEEITAYAAELGRDLPNTPDSQAARAQAMQHVITDILTTGETHGQD